MIKAIIISCFAFFSALATSQNLNIDSISCKKDSTSQFYNNITSKEFISKFYSYNNIEQFLDNYSEHITYQIETAGDISISDNQIFSIAGNSFQWNKYYIDNFRTNDLFFSGNNLYRPNFLNYSIEIDKNNGALLYNSELYENKRVGFSLNHSGLGGPAIFTDDLIHLFHRTAREALYIPIDEQRRVLFAGNIFTNYQIPFGDKMYNQYFSIDYGKRIMPDFDYKGIKEFYPENYTNIQATGELPLILKSFDSNNYLFSFNNRSNLFSEQYYGKNETAKLSNFNFSIYGKNRFLTSGLNLSFKKIAHNEPNFYRNIIDQDGEAFEPWYSDALIFDFSVPLYYKKEIKNNLFVKADLFNGLVFNNPTTGNYKNAIYLESYERSFTSLYLYEWRAEKFVSGLLENTIGISKNLKLLNQKMIIKSDIDITFDGFVVADKSKFSPNFQLNLETFIKPVKFFEMAVLIGRKRISYNYENIKYFSNHYLNANIYYWNDINNNQLYDSGESNNLFSNSGGKWHNLSSELRQPAYLYLDIPIKLNFTKSFTIELLPFFKKYNNFWLTQYPVPESEVGFYENNNFYLNQGVVNYDVVPFYSSYMQSESNSLIENSPFTKGYTFRFQVLKPKFFFSASWTAYMVVGYSALGNGILHNNLNVLSESHANPNTQIHNTGRIDSDKSYVGRMLISYNFSEKFSSVFQLKYKDGQPFSFFLYDVKSDSLGNQAAIQNEKPKGDNPLNLVVGPRKDAFFNTELRFVYIINLFKNRLDLNLSCYNIYDFGTELAEYAFSPAKDNRYVLELNIPRGIVFSAIYNF